MMAADLLGAGIGAVFGGAVSWAATTRTLAPKIAALTEAVKAVGGRLDDHGNRIGRLETIHLQGHGQGD